VKCPYHRAGTRAASAVIIAIAHWIRQHIVMAQIKRYTVKVWSFGHEGLAVYMCVLGCPQSMPVCSPICLSTCHPVQVRLYWRDSMKLCTTVMFCFICVWCTIFWSCPNLAFMELDFLLQTNIFYFYFQVWF
jgi:hypothetical protein